MNILKRLVRRIGRVDSMPTFQVHCINPFHRGGQKLFGPFRVSYGGNKGYGLNLLVLGMSAWIHKHSTQEVTN